MPLLRTLGRQNKAVRGCGGPTDLSPERLVSQNITADLGEIAFQKHRRKVSDHRQGQSRPLCSTRASRRPLPAGGHGPGSPRRRTPARGPLPLGARGRDRIQPTRAAEASPVPRAHRCLPGTVGSPGPVAIEGFCARLQPCPFPGTISSPSWEMQRVDAVAPVPARTLQRRRGQLYPSPRGPARSSRFQSPRRYRRRLSRPGLRLLPRRGCRGPGLRQAEPSAPRASGLLISPPTAFLQPPWGGSKPPGLSGSFLGLPPPVPGPPSLELRTRVRDCAAAGTSPGRCGAGGRGEAGKGREGREGEAVGWGKLILAGLSRSSCW
ncbi:hypothetical protein VULLAG_LOCUS17869 [Vulpes lagopus]